MGTMFAKRFSKEKGGSSKKLDDVIILFKSVLNGSQLDTEQLLKACRAHLVLMRSGGAALKVESAAMGLLWIRRSLAFQLDLYLAVVSSHTRHPQAAAMEAYDKTLSPYRGWLLQKVFPMSLSQLPDRRTFIAKFGGRDSYL